MKPEPRLILEDGSVFEGISFGFERSIVGEVVFNTGMVGYLESLTDPSYKGQILVLTYPLIGNYGVPKLKESFESDRIQVSGLIVSDYSYEYSHWSAIKNLSQWLKEENIPALTGIDCRALTKRLREKGVMLGKIVFREDSLPFEDPNRRNLIKEVSIKRPTLYKRGKIKIALIDCGVKNNIIRSLLRRGVSVIRFPYDYNIFNCEYSFDAIVISNGPGDPKLAEKTVALIRKALDYPFPILGICLGNQILTLAAGGDTYKLKYGHRSQNQPCLLLNSKRCYITSQNHGYAVREESLPKGWYPWFRNANDSTNEGIRHYKRPFMAVQFHPEASPGPTDTGFLFDEFLSHIKG